MLCNEHYVQISRSEHYVQISRSDGKNPPSDGAESTTNRNERECDHFSLMGGTAATCPAGSHVKLCRKPFKFDQAKFSLLKIATPYSIRQNNGFEVTSEMNFFPEPDSRFVR